jgi:hypothetical protein
MGDKKKYLKKNMRNFSILKVDDVHTLKQYPSVRYRLDPSAVSTKQSGVTTTPPDGVSIFLIETQIF